jgi:iron(III) transport system permease protein
MIVLQGAALAAPAFFMIVPCLQAIDVTLEEAAAASGVRRAATALHIVLPLAAPAILAACAYYFIIAIEMFDYASMLGMPARIFVASTWLYQMINAGIGLPHYGEAAALGLLMAAGSLLVSVIYLWSIGKAARYAVVTGKHQRRQPLRLNRAAKVIAWILILVYALFSFALPVLTLLWASGQPFMQLPTPLALSQWTLEAYQEAFAELPPLIYNNLVVMLAAPTISVALAACVAWAGARLRGQPRSQGRGLRRGLDLFVMMAIAVPSIVSALGFLYFGLAVYRAIPIYTTVWLMVLAMSTRYLTWANRTISSSLMQVHPEIEEACATSGIRPGPAFVSVMLPTINRALLYSWFWLALLSLRELTIPIMLARPNTAVMATAIWSLNAAGNADVAAAMSIILVCVTIVMVFAFHKIAGERTI